ncbi:unnamed protein product [Clonostachys rhizophaga]|uniref:Uncharacterized protein n=1 Tax=Clonostachys rhizophaga TaxID=160324 RepID=A0A9N9YGS6_9HYPO|nr:unnamed protein product [Clonostachys rhizophaga]
MPSIEAVLASAKPPAGTCSHQTAGMPSGIRRAYPRARQRRGPAADRGPRAVGSGP